MLLNVVVDDRSEARGVQVVLHEAHLCAPFMQRRALHLPAIGKGLAVRVEAEMEETRLARSEEAALIPLRDVVVVPGLLVGHRLTW